MNRPHLSRRSLLAAGCAGAVAAVASPRPSKAAAAASTAPLTLGIQLYSLRGYKVDEALQHAKELGLTRVEFYPGMYPINSDAAAIAAMNAKLADLPFHQRCRQKPGDFRVCQAGRHHDPRRRPRSRLVCEPR